METAMKLRLKVDELRVETFETTRATAKARGTVRALQATPPDNCFSGVWSCIPDASCGETCGMSCNGSCVNTYDCCM
jgi:hypothetical protein